MSVIVTLGSLAIVLVSCGAGGADAPGTTGDAPPPPTTAADEATGPTATGGVLGDGPSALDNPDDPSFPEPLIDPAEIISGGPPPDGIPPIDEPRFVGVDAADRWLEDGEPVVVVEIDGQARAYPIQVLVWHEIINDTVGGVPVAVTYCPLCNSAVTFERVIDGVETTFGTSGRLYASALVMYDRATESLWTHFDGRAVAGVLTGSQLEPIPSPLLAWSEFAAAFPDGEVLDRDATGHSRPYGTNPYVGYDDPDASPFLFRGTVDDRARAMQRVVGVSTGGAAKAWTLQAVTGVPSRATNDTVGDSPVVIFWKAGQASALESETVGDGRDVGSVGVFSPMVEGEIHTFSAEGDGFVDSVTGSTWDITGRAVDGPLAGTRLEAIHHLDTFWFAWATYQPSTELVER